MSTESEGPKQPPKADDKKKAEKEKDAKPAAAAAPAAAGPAPALDERKLKYGELLPHAGAYQPNDLLAMLQDGRAIVRGNAALALAASNQAAPELVQLVRDSEQSVALAVAEAFAKLGPLARPLIPQIVQALDSAKPDVLDSMLDTLGQHVGKADDELTAALDVPFDLAMKTVVDACKRAGKGGVAMLAKATRHERSRVRVNAAGGLGKIGKTDPDTALAALNALEQGDPVPDVRTAAKQAILAVVAREKVEAVDALPKNIPDFEVRKLTLSELSEYADQIDVDQMLFALQDGRDHVRVNGARGLAAKGAKAARTATSIGLLLRDSVAAVRREAAKAIGKLGPEGVAAAPELVGALGDAESDVVDAATDTLSAFGERAIDALVKGLEAGGEEHGRRVAELITKSPRAADLLTEAFGSAAVNVQVNAAAGLGMLGKNGVGAKGLAALHGARTGGDVRTRAAVRAALDIIEAKGDTGPKEVSIAGFEDRFLAAADLDKAKAELERAGVADLTAHLTDGRDVVRANAALALGALGAASAGSALPLGVLLRDDSPRVRLAAAQALDRIGDTAVIETADYLVGALRDSDEKVAETVANVVRARKTRMISALVRGLETDDPRHAARIVEVINVLPDATEILCDAFESPAVNTQVNAALGLGMLGKDRVGKGRKALEGARTGGDARTREAVRKALDTLDGPKAAGPQELTVEGFETKVLDAAAFGDVSKLRIDDLAHFLNDGRPVVRANAATALGAIGPTAVHTLSALGVLCRDDDMRVRIAAANAIDKLGDDAVREIAPFLVGAMRGDAEVAKVVSRVLGARNAKVLGALVKGLETDDETQARRILELINALPDACEILCDAFESPAENVQVNAAMGIGMLGEKRAGSAGKKKLEGARTGGFARTREAVFKALAALKNG
ncbi:MAG TPA: HEAT repeat domain-containing protein [Kofleriaceae bacterium]|nr:HEAT repeat domain-containing protein [Kofleriaceae bacterium]